VSRCRVSVCGVTSALTSETTTKRVRSQSRGGMSESRTGSSPSHLKPRQTWQRHEETASGRLDAGLTSTRFQKHLWFTVYYLKWINVRGNYLETLKKHINKIYLYIYTNIYIYICIYVCIYIYIYVFIYICILHYMSFSRRFYPKRLTIYICMYIYIYIIYIKKYVYIYI